jgi:hypothetical protein
VSKQDDALTLTFEERAVALLRLVTTPRKASRTEMTRAEFALSIVRESGIAGFVSPQLHMTQPVEPSTAGVPSDEPITTSDDRVSDADRKAGMLPGLADDATLYARDAGGTRYVMTSEQKQNAERVLDVCRSLGADERASLAVLEAVMIESNLKNLTGGDLDSRGILQVRDSTASGMGIDNRDIEQCVNAFLTRGFWGKGGAISIAAKYPDQSTGWIAQQTQGSAYPSRYDVAEPEARALLAAYTATPSGGSGSGTNGGGTSVLLAREPRLAPRAKQQKTIKQDPYQFQRGGTDGLVENSWDCLQRLASEVNWRCFVVDGDVYFVSETTLVAQKPVAVLSEGKLGVDGIDFDVDNGQTDSQATVTVRAFRQAFPPGSTVLLEDCGPANGRWLVRDVSRGVFDAQATLSLKRATEPLPEPAGDTTASVDAGAATGSAADEAKVAGATAEELGLTGDVAKVYEAARAMTAKRWPYVWGGGHAKVGTPDGGTGRDPGIGFDCSGSVAAVLAAGGLGYQPGGAGDVSGTMARSYGDAGEGKQLTLYANDDHVFLVFKTNQGLIHFGTGDWGKGFDGPGINPNLHPTAGFTARHWPGT